MKSKLDNFILQEDLNVLVSPIKKDFSYSDGSDTEKKILDILNETQDLSCFSRELIQEIYDWPSEYHFSPIRQNLLRHIHFNSTDKILELGAGCGSITRLLGESGAKVTAIEGSLNRAKAAAARCRDLDNVKVYCSNFQSIDFTEKYDYVTLIGVLEYSPIYFNSYGNPSDSVKSCLKLAKSLLKENGILIIAIENQLGLKYFCGYPEDHTSRPFFGIEDKYDKSTAITFGKKEISNILNFVGFKSIIFQYPFPDYKLPSLICTEQAFQNEEFAPEEIIRNIKSQDYSKNHNPTINDSLVWSVLSRNNLIEDMSNSFLIFAGETKNSIDKDFKDLLAVGFAANRTIEYNTMTTFIQDLNKKIIVRKKKLSEITNNSKQDIILLHNLEDQEYVKGKNLGAEINRIVAINDFDGFIRYLKKWIKFIFDNGIKTLNKDNIYCSTFTPNFLDCLPNNLIISDEGLKYIDQEWILNKEYWISSLILRYLIRNFNCSDCPFIDTHISSSQPILVRLTNYLGFSLTESVLQNFIDLESEIATLVYPWVESSVKNTDIKEPIVTSLNKNYDRSYFIQKVKYKVFNKIGIRH